MNTQDIANVLRLEVPGATEEQIEAGLAAAVEVLTYAGADPETAFCAYMARLAWRMERGPRLSDLELELAAFFTVAQLTALDHAIGVNAPRPEGARLFVGPRLH